MRRWRPGAVDADPELIVLTVLAVLLYVGAARRGAGLAAIPGYATVRPTLAGVRWPWLLVSLGGVAAALAGYLLAWRGIARGGVGGGSLSRRQQFAAVPPHHCERKGKVMATRETGFGGTPALCPPTTATLPEALSVTFSERNAYDNRLMGACPADQHRRACRTEPADLCQTAAGGNGCPV